MSESPCKLWWQGDKRVEPFMGPVAEAIDRHLESGRARTDIYNRAYEAVYKAIKACELVGCESRTDREEV